MRVRFERPGDQPMAGLVADRRLYLDKHGKMVEEAQADFLLAAKGHVIPMAEAKRLDLHVWSDGRVMQGAEPAPEPVVMPEPVVPAAPLADVVQPAGKMEEPKAKAPRAPKKSKE